MEAGMPIRLSAVRDDRCAFCGSRKIREFCRVAVVDLHGDYDFCLDCGVYFANPIATDAELFEHYQKYYEDLDSQTSEDARNRAYRVYGELWLPKIQKWVSSGRYLEIGCGVGANLAAARDAGYETVGVELAAPVVEFARSHYGLDARACRVEDLAEPEGSFDVIFTSHTIEHVIDLASFISTCRDLLRPDGLLFVCTENPESLFHRLYAFAHKLNGLGTPLNSSSTEHTFLLSPRFLRRNAPIFGFDVRSIRAYEERKWVSQRTESSIAYKRMLKGAVWGSVSWLGHATNTGSLLHSTLIRRRTL